MMCRNTVRWLYRIDRSYSWESGLEVSQDLVFRDAEGKVRLVVEVGGRLTVMAGYAWNGCSPKVCVLDILVGTPDGAVHERTGKPKTYFASMVHDALYQFLDAESPITRVQADGCFFRLMAESDFVLRHLYWLAVRAFGRLVWQGKKTVRKWRGEVVPIPLLAVHSAGRQYQQGAV
ncbi:MAG: hypothetical protein HY892_12070 [Deltaproteobacteria bacterium]|nr:hypothetical protein [Deltaproteobacteria bacterium]